jgi:hypothetical protein
MRKKKRDTKPGELCNWNYYGLDPHVFYATLDLGCAICGSDYMMVMDHDHVTNIVRGPLCNGCNGSIKPGLAMLKANVRNNPKYYLPLIAYLENPPGPWYNAPRAQVRSIK